MGLGSGPGTALSEWVVGMGGSVHSALHIRTSPDGGLCLGTTTALEPGTTLITLPTAAQLGSTAPADPDLAALARLVPAELWSARLALSLLRERAAGPDGSDFWPYVAALPQGFAGLPLFFPREAVEALQYPPLIQQVNKRSRWLLGFAAEHADTPRPAFLNSVVDVGGLAWAWGATSSRAFRAQRDAVPVLLPLIDLANHTFDGPSAKVEGVPGSKDTRMVTARALRAGEEVTLCYGELSNDNLLLDYGFIVAGNPYDTVQLRFDFGLVAAAQSLVGLEAAEQLGPAANAALVALKLAGEGADTAVVIRTAGVEQHAPPCDPRLLAGVRAICAKTAELQGVTLRALGDWATPLPLPSEARALRTMTGICAISLSHFPTSMEEDEALLDKGSLSHPVTQAVQLRLGKKKILNVAIKTFAARIRELHAAELARKA